MRFRFSCRLSQRLSCTGLCRIAHTRLCRLCWCCGGHDPASRGAATGRACGDMLVARLAAHHDMPHVCIAARPWCARLLPPDRCQAPHGCLRRAVRLQAARWARRCPAVGEALRLCDPRLVQLVAGVDALAAHSSPERDTTRAAPLAGAPVDGPGAGRRTRGRRALGAHGALPTYGAGLGCQKAVQRAAS